MDAVMARSDGGMLLYATEVDLSDNPIQLVSRLSSYAEVRITAFLVIGLGVIWTIASVRDAAYARKHKIEED
jgi:hypothetical protein